MTHEILSVKLCQLSDRVGRLRSRIHMSETASHSQLRREIGFLERECAEAEMTLRENLRGSKSNLVSVVAQSYEQMERIIQNTKPANKKSSMRDVKIYGYGKTREKYNKKAVRKGRPKGRRSTVIPPRQGQAASPCLRASLTLRAASAIGQPRG